MKVKQWRYFWGWAVLFGGLLTGCSLFLLFIEPTAYVSRLVFEPLELYPGEDLSPPAAPPGISIESQPPAGLGRWWHRARPDLDVAVVEDEC